MPPLMSTDAKKLDNQFRESGRALSDKTVKLLSRTIKVPAIEAAKCIVAMCPSSLQTPKMCCSEVVKKFIPLVDATEWDRYTALPAQQPPPTTTAARVHWWRVRMQDFPKLAPVCIAYLLAPRSAAQAERMFSLLGHVSRCPLCGFHFQRVPGLYPNV